MGYMGRYMLPNRVVLSSVARTGLSTICDSLSCHVPDSMLSAKARGIRHCSFRPPRCQPFSLTVLRWCQRPRDPVLLQSWQSTQRLRTHNSIHSLHTVAVLPSWTHTYVSILLATAIKRAAAGNTQRGHRKLLVRSMRLGAITKTLSKAGFEIAVRPYRESLQKTKVRTWSFKTVVPNCTM